MTTVADAPVVVTEPGIYADMPEDVYHGDPVPETSLSNSGAKLLLDCPARFHHAQQCPKTSKAFDEGTAAHAKVLGVGAEVVELPDDILASNGAVSTAAAKAFVAEARQAGQVPLKSDVVARIDAMAARLLEHPVASALLRTGEAETSLFDRDPDTKVMLRARLDWRTRLRSGRPVIVDYKTSVSANPAQFGRTAADFGYHGQDPWYVELADRLFDEQHAFLFVVQEKTAPFLVSVCELDDDAREAGRIRNRHARRLYLECMTSGVWPGYAPTVHPVSLPPWALRDTTPISECEIPA
jgi:hypothetical protein